MVKGERSWEAEAVKSALEGGDIAKAWRLVEQKSDANQTPGRSTVGTSPGNEDDDAKLGFLLMDTMGREMIEEGQVMSSLYEAMQQRGWLGGFAIARPRETWPFQSRVVSPKAIEELTGLPYTSLRAKRSNGRWWQFAGVSLVFAIAGGLQSLGLGEYSKPALLGFLGLLALDQTVLRGLLFDSVYRVVSPGYEEKLRRHEAGHFLVAYIVGAPVLGYILNAKEAFRRGIPGRGSGQAMTLFNDPVMSRELQAGRLTDSSIDRHAIILMAGIAAEALHYGEAEGGASDESVLVSLLTNLNPPWRGDQILNEARWAALQAILLIKKYNASYEQLVEAMRQDKPLGECIQAIESAMPVTAGGSAGEAVIEEAREKLEQREERVRKLVSEISVEVDRTRLARDRQVLKQKEEELEARWAELAERELEFNKSREFDPAS